MNTMKILAVLSVSVLALPLIIVGDSPASAQQGGSLQATLTMDCSPQGPVAAHLAKKYKEAPVAAGITSGGAVVQVYTTESGDTWTIIVTNIAGMTCLVSAGENWRTKEYDVPEQGDLL